MLLEDDLLPEEQNGDEVLESLVSLFGDLLAQDLVRTFLCNFPEGSLRVILHDIIPDLIGDEQLIEKLHDIGFARPSYEARDDGEVSSE